MSRAKKLQLAADLQGIEGCGENVIFKVNAYRTTKAGRHESYELRLEGCRYAVMKILRGLAEMHERDRERISHEQRRIEKEIAALTSKN